MGAAAGPNVVEDGLVLALDAGNSKNYNVGVSTNWTDTIGGNNGTLNGGTYHTDGPFVGAGYVEFDGTGDKLSLDDSSDWDFGSENFTIEFFLYADDLSSRRALVTQRNANSVYAPFYLGYNASNNLRLYASSDGSNWDIADDVNFGSLTTNRWYHIALIRNGTQFVGYVDGTGTNLVTSSATLVSSSHSLAIGGDLNTTTFDLDGKISNLRIVKGTALYTSNFTPPTTTLTNVTNTVLLTCQGNTIEDASSSAHTITVNGDAAANLGSPASAFEFDGVDDEITIPYTPNLAFTDAIFSCEAWVYADTLVDGSKEFSIINKRGNNSTQNTNRPYVFEVNGDGRVRWILDDATTICDTASGLIQTGQWYHLAATHDGTNAKIYVNGIENVSVASGTSSLNDTGDIPTRIGWRYQNSSINYSDGRIGEVRIYPRALTAAQVFQNYNALKGRYIN